ncbi:hypothetical protein Tco_0732623 [Tanacetum coccineum]
MAMKLTRTVLVEIDSANSKGNETPSASTSTLVNVASSATWDKDGDKDGEDVILEGDVAGVVVDVGDCGCSVTGGYEVEGVSTMGVSSEKPPCYVRTSP